MPQKPVVYVRRITNLSDARYCAGMGVDMLGFVVDPGHEDYVSPSHFQEMIGWIAGPKRVAEIIAPDKSDLTEVVHQYAPDLLHLSLNTVGHLTIPDLPLILEIPAGEWPASRTAVRNLNLSIAFLLLTLHLKDTTNLPAFEGDYSVLLSLDKEFESVTSILKQTHKHGFVLQGSSELTPGLKDYDHLSRILEELEG